MFFTHATRKDILSLLKMRLFLLVESRNLQLCKSIDWRSKFWTLVVLRIYPKNFRRPIVPYVANATRRNVFPSSSFQIQKILQNHIEPEN